MEPDQPSMKRALLPGNSKKSASHTSMGEKLRHDPHGGIAGNGETDALGHGDNGRIDPDDVTRRIDQRPA